MLAGVFRSGDDGRFDGACSSPRADSFDNGGYATHPRTLGYCTPSDLSFYRRIYLWEDSAISSSPCSAAGIRPPPFSYDSRLPYTKNSGINQFWPFQESAFQPLFSLI